MQNRIPHFQYNTKGDVKNHFGHIDADGEIVHWVKDFDEFYRTLGYTNAMAKKGIVPDEFIWDEYIKDGTVNSTACMQMHIIEYLGKYSDSFRKKYGDQYKSWIATNAKPEKDELCISCNMKQFCPETLWQAEEKRLNSNYKPTIEEEIAIESELDACFAGADSSFEYA